MLANRSTKQVFDTSLQVSNAFNTQDFKVIWSSSSNAFLVMSTPTEGGDTVLKIIGYVSGFTSDLSQTMVKDVDETISGQHYTEDTVFGLSQDGNYIVARARNLDSAPSEDAQDIELVLWGTANSSQNRVIAGIDGKRVVGAQFRLDISNRLLFVNETGLAEYDLTSNQTSILSGQINSSWARIALFSPSGEWIAVIHEGEGGNSIYVVNATNPIISSPTPTNTSTPTLSPTNTPTPTSTLTPTLTNTPTVTPTTTGSQLTTLSPAQVWIGLKNSDDVGIKFDLMAEVYKGTDVIGSGQLNSVAGGSSGFNNAHMYSVPLTLASPVSIPPGEQLSIKVYVRNACSGSGKNSGFARLWYNDSQANSQFGVTINSTAKTYYLLDSFALGTNPGSGLGLTRFIGMEK